jgi:hypothetical protein
LNPLIHACRQIPQNLSAKSNYSVHFAVASIHLFFFHSIPNPSTSGDRVGARWSQGSFAGVGVGDSVDDHDGPPPEDEQKPFRLLVLLTK